MNNLKLIENQIVPVYETDKGIKVVNGRELHQVLGSKQDFSTWIKRRLSECDAEENEDYDCFHKKMEANNATMIEYIIKLDTAKEMAMLERNEKGKQVRKYFIAIEKKYKRRQIPMTIPEQIQLLARGNVELNQKVNNLDKKIEDLEYSLPILGIEIDRITTAVKKKGVECLGGKNSEAYTDRSLRGKVYNDIYRELKRQFGVSTYKAIKRNQCEVAVEVISSYKLPYVLASQVQFKNAQVNLWGGVQA